MPAPTDVFTFVPCLSLHDPLPISVRCRCRYSRRGDRGCALCALSRTPDSGDRRDARQRRDRPAAGARLRVDRRPVERDGRAARNRAPRDARRCGPVARRDPGGAVGDPAPCSPPCCMTEDDARAWVRDRYGVSRETSVAHFCDLVRAESTEQNLIAASTLESIWQRHVVDSAQLLDWADRDGSWLDVGAGAGFPGVLVALLSDRQVALDRQGVG